MIDKLLGGRYRIIRTLGGGGFGQTYIAQDTHRPGNPHCVVKHLKPASVNSGFLQNSRRLFQTEAETLEKLGNHDQIPRLLAYFEENREFFLVQEYIQGYTLNAELPLGKRWSESQVYQLLNDVLTILVFVHSRGVIHRDIKPDNLIRHQHDSKLFLVDFGAVKQIRTQPLGTLGPVSQTVAIGTPGYMPTEQQRGKPRPNSDIYALGIIGIQALTGLHPMQFQEDSNNGEIVWQHQLQVNCELASVLTKMVCYHFKERYQTAAEALQALQLKVNRADLNSDTGIAPVQQPRMPQPTVISPPLSQDRSGRDALPLKQHSTLQPTIISPPPSQVPVPSQEEIAHSFAIQTAGRDNCPSTVVFRKPDFRLIGAGITAALISAIASYSVLYRQPNASIQETQKQIESLKAEGKLEDCVNQATKIPQSSRFYKDAQALRYECQLAQARKLAADGKLAEAIAEASKIPQTDTSYQAAQPLINQWSDSMLEIAKNQYHLGKSNEAIATAKTIPKTSPVYQKAQGSIKQWNGEWEKNTSYLLAAQKALKEGKWQNAISEAKKVTDTPYWQKQIEPIAQTAESKIAASKAAVSSQPKPPVTKTATRTTARPVARNVYRKPARTVTRTTRTVTRRAKRFISRRSIGITPKRPSNRRWSKLVWQTGSDARR